jgi:acetyl esterase/lipase
MTKVSRPLPGAGALLLALLLAACGRVPNPEYEAACHGPPLGAEGRQKALEQGYGINERFDCIDKRSWEEVQRALAMVDSMARQAEAELKQAEQETAAAAADRIRRGSNAPTALAVARRSYETQFIAINAGTGDPFPDPPEALFVRSDFDSPGAGKLAAWVTPDPKDGVTHPAIVWITGGDSSSLDDFWTDRGPDRDESASAFRKAGVVMMFPTLRGGNKNPGRRQYFYGEVDDVIAAAAHLSSLPYVDRVYLGGHSTGGTLALLVAESTNRFQAVFVFGAVSDIGVYPGSLLPFDLATADARERKLRSPIHWLEQISTPTYLIEGRDEPGNIAELDALCTHTRNPAVICIPVPGRNHFSVLDTVAKKLAARIVVRDPEDRSPLLKAAEFSRAD